MQVIDGRFKDADPLETVEKIRSILSKSGIFLTEKWFDSGVKGCYSLRIEIEGTTIGQNGKGVTKEFARASAYAEFMERLQSGYLYVGRERKELQEYLGFIYTPDEKEFSTSEYLFSYPDILTKVANNLSASGSPVNMITLAGILSYGESLEEGKEFTALPFRSLTGGKDVYLPIPLLRDCYATSGTCAGNSEREAVIQGLSEIMERKHTLKVLRDHPALPTIPDEYLSRFPAFEMIKDIRHHKDTDIIIKDCSFGEGYPVIGAALVNRKSHKCILRFGSHPVFEIALERTITEMFQGRSITNESSMYATPFSFSMKDVLSPANLHCAIKNATGKFYYDFILEGGPFTPFEDRRDWDNEKLYHYATGFFKEKGLEVYIRNCGYLGFPAFQLIVPGFSEIYDSGTMRIRERRSQKRAIETLLKLEEAEEEDLKALFTYLTFKFFFSAENTLSYTLSQPLMLEMTDFSGYLDLVLALSAHFDKWELIAAYTSEIGKSDSYNANDEYMAVHEYAKARSAGVKEKSALEYLSIVYDEKTMEKLHLLMDWKQSSAHFGTFCRENMFQGAYNAYPKWEEIRRKLKEVQLAACKREKE